MKLQELRKELEESKNFIEAKNELILQFALGDAVLKARIKKGWSQEQLAEAIGTKQANISRIESGLSNPTLAVIQKLSNVLDFQVDIKFNEVRETEFTQKSLTLFTIAQEYISFDCSSKESVFSNFETISRRSDTRENVFA